MKSFLFELLVFTACHPHPQESPRYLLAFCFSLSSFLLFSLLCPLSCSLSFLPFLPSFLACLQEWTSKFLSSLHWISSAERFLIHERLNGRRSFTDSGDMRKDNIDTSNGLPMALKETTPLLGPYFHTPKSDFTSMKQCRVSKKSEEEAEAEAIK